MDDLTRRDFVKVTTVGAAGLALGAAGAGATTMSTRPLGKTSHNVYLFSLGGQSALEEPGNEDLAQAIINRAIDLGVNYLDTAAQYGNGISQKYLGMVMAKRRKKVFLATKTHDRTRDGALRMLEQSLTSLRTDHLDLWQIHNIQRDEQVERVFAKGGAIEALLQARDQKMVRYLGITGHYDPTVLARAIERFPFDTVLMAVNAADRHRLSFVDTLLPLATRKRMGVIGMKVPAKGRVFRPGGVTTMRQAMHYVLSQPVSTVIIGCQTVAQLEENVAIAKAFTPMPAAEQRRLEQLTASYEAEATFFKKTGIGWGVGIQDDQNTGLRVRTGSTPRRNRRPRLHATAHPCTPRPRCTTPRPHGCRHSRRRLFLGAFGMLPPPLSRLAPVDRDSAARRLAVGVGLVAAAGAITAATWPLLSATPFFVFFAACLLGGHWGTRLSTAVTVTLAIIVAPIVLTWLGLATMRPASVVVFALLSAGGAWTIRSRRAQEARTRGMMEQLRVSEERYRHFFEDDLTGDYVTTPDGAIIDCNRAFARMFGFADLAEAQACHAAELYACPDERDRFLERIRLHGRIEREHAMFVRRDGTRIHTVQNAVGEFDGHGTLVAMHGYLFDITESKRAQAALAQSDAMLRGVVANAPLVLWAVDPAGVFTLSEGKGLEALALVPGQLVGQSLFDVYRDMPAIIEHNRRALAGETVTGVAEVGGTTFETWCSPLRDDTGEVLGAIGVGVDITERTRLEAQLRHDQRMKAIGQLAGGIAHDFNNLLTAILGYTDVLLADRGPDDKWGYELTTIRQAGESAAALTRQLLAFSRRQVIQPKAIILNEVVDEMASLLRRLIGENVHLMTHLCPTLDSVWADPAQLQQVILNLAVNARDAMPGGGTLTIRTDNVVLDEPYAHQHRIAPVPGPYVRLTVSDTGHGMDPETQARIFEPFFTTKAPGKGTGLGMATVYGVVKQSGGYVWAYSELERGTTFKVYLPSQPREAASDVTTDAPTVDDLTGTETILLVEDEPAVRLLGYRGLREYGYTVIDASTAEEALIRARAHTGIIDLVVTDVVLPGASGAQLVAEFRKEGIQIPALFVSGYAEHHLTNQGVLAPDVLFLEKPFTPSQLARKVRAVLSAPDRAASV